MGVAGCGKSTIAALLADHHNMSLIEADNLHTSENIDKMRRGEALCDDDRWPWLIRVAEAIKASSKPAFVSCSCLRRAYRQCLLDNAHSNIGFIHLHTEQQVIAKRIESRRDHFMPVSLLNSQYQILEPLECEEIGVIVDINQSIDGVFADAMRFVERN